MFVSLAMAVVLCIMIYLEMVRAHVRELVHHFIRSSARHVMFMTRNVKDGNGLFDV